MRGIFTTEALRTQRGMKGRKGEGEGVKINHRLEGLGFFLFWTRMDTDGEREGKERGGGIYHRGTEGTEGEGKGMS